MTTAATPAARSSLRTGFSWLLGANVISAGCRWAMASIIAKLGSATLLGEFAIGLAITTPVFFLSSLGLRSVQATDAARRFGRHEYFWLRACTTVVALLLVVGIAAGTGYRGRAFWVITLVGLSKAFEAIGDVTFGFLIQGGRINRVAFSTALKGGFGALALGAALYLTGSLVWGSGAMALAMALVVVLVDLPGLRGDGPSTAASGQAVSARRLLDLALHALPAGIAGGLVALEMNVPRYFLDATWGAAEVGLFSAAIAFVSAGHMIISAVMEAASPRLAELALHGAWSRFARLLGRLSLVAAAVGVAGILGALVAGPWALRQFFSAEFEPFAPQLLTVMVAGAFVYLASVINYALLAMRRMRTSVLFVGLACLVVAAASWALVPAGGGGAAGIALALGYGTHVVLGAGFICATSLRAARTEAGR